MTRYLDLTPPPNDPWDTVLAWFCGVGAAVYVLVIVWRIASGD